MSHNWLLAWGQKLSIIIATAVAQHQTLLDPIYLKTYIEVPWLTQAEIDSTQLDFER